METAEQSEGAGREGIGGRSDSTGRRLSDIRALGLILLTRHAVIAEDREAAVLELGVGPAEAASVP